MTQPWSSEDPWSPQRAGPVRAQLGAPVTERPDNHLIGAILSTIFCCLPAGVVSIVLAAQVDSRWDRGDVEGAVRASERAASVVAFSVVAGVVAVVIAVVFALAGG